MRFPNSTFFGRSFLTLLIVGQPGVRLSEQPSWEGAKVGWLKNQPAHFCTLPGRLLRREPGWPTMSNVKNDPPFLRNRISTTNRNHLRGSAVVYRPLGTTLSSRCGEMSPPRTNMTGMTTMTAIPDLYFPNTRCISWAM